MHFSQSFTSVAWTAACVPTGRAAPSAAMADAAAPSAAMADAKRRVDVPKGSGAMPPTLSSNGFWAKIWRRGDWRGGDMGLDDDKSGKWGVTEEI